MSPARALVRLGLALLLVAAATSPARAAAAAPPIEVVGSGDAITGIVLPGERIAGVVLWPLRSAELRSCPAGTAAVAVRAVLAQALAREPGARPLLEWGPGFVALGAELPAGAEERLGAVLAALANPALPAPAAVQTTQRQVADLLAERWADPLERARMAALALAFPGVHAAWNALGSPTTLAQVDSSDVQVLLSGVRRRPVEVRLAGPAGLAARLAPLLGARTGVPPEDDEERAVGALPAAALLPHAAAKGARDSSAIVVAQVLPAEELEQLGPPLAVLLEGLGEGQGSLRQRLRVGMQDDAGSVVDLVPTGDGGAVLVLGARTRKEALPAAWRVLDGTLSSLRSLPLREDAVLLARNRLDEQALYRYADAAAGLLGHVRRAAWSWPPAGDEPDRPVTAADVRQAAQRLLLPETRILVAAGALSEEIAALPDLRAGLRLDWNRFDPLADAPVPQAPLAGRTPASPEGVRLARELLAALVEQPERELPPFAARYRVVEPTPFGPAESGFRIEGGPGGTGAGASRDGWTLSLRSNDEGAEARLEGRHPATVTIADPDRLPALLFREPALLAAAVAMGTVPASRLKVDCGERLTCPALRAELAEGTVLILELDAGGRTPRALRIWASGRSEEKAPDEQVSYQSWQRVGRVRLASEMVLVDAYGLRRTMRLEEWSWKDAAPPAVAPPPATGSSPPADPRGRGARAGG